VKAGGGKGPWFWVLWKERRIRRLDEVLPTPETVRNLQKKLYVKAKNEPGFRFYSLYDKVYRDDVLAHAFRLARANKGAPGVDGIRFQDLLGEEEAFLAELKEELKTKTYRPKPVRRVYIPKPDGGQRPLGIPCIRDRVVQTAAKLVLEPIFEADFPPNEYAYRPERGAHDAIKHVHGLLRDGYTDVVDADLSKYFDTIPHRELLRSVARRISDGEILALVKLWLEAPVEERDEEGKGKLTGTTGTGVGTPQGGVISPLLANIYMRRFLLAWEQWELPRKLQAHVVNYADDFVILCRRGAEEALRAAREILTRLKLTVNEEKTRLVNAWRAPFDFLGYTFGPCYAVGSGRTYLGAKPAKKRLLRFYRTVRAFLHEHQGSQPYDMILRLNLKIGGWANYYSYGTLSKAYGMLDGLIVRRVRAWFCRRQQLAGLGTRRFSDQVLYREFGLACLTQDLAKQRRSYASRETSPRAGCRKSARPVRRAGGGNGVAYHEPQ